MPTKPFVRTLVAMSIAASIAACGEKAEEITEIVEEQQQEQTQQTEQEVNYENSGGDAPSLPSASQTMTEAYTIEVPGGVDYTSGAYPWNASGTTKFWYGLDEHTVTVPAADAANHVYHLTFAGDYAVDGSKGPGVEFSDKLEEINSNVSTEVDVTIVLPEGEYAMNHKLRADMSLYSNIQSLTLMGQGIDKTILNYNGSDEDASDSVHITGANGLEVAHFSVIDSGKNAILVDESNGVHMHHLGTIWPGKPDAGNGAYGLYPVESQNVIVEDSFAFGSADAGIYVGQTDNIVVRNSFAVQNVAGIEIENSNSADVYNNYAYMNTGGILVFDLPIGNGRYGYGTRVFNNVSVANNEENFAAHGVVGMVPPGTGVLLLASEGVEVFNNKIIGNDTFAVVGSSYFLIDSNVLNYTGNPAGPTPGSYASVIQDGWRPTLRAINIFDNAIYETGANPRGDLLEAALADGAPGVLAAFKGVSGYVPSILTDGMGQNLANNNIIAQAITSTGGIAFEGAYDDQDSFCVDPQQGASTGTVIEHTGATSVVNISDFSLNLAAATFEVDNAGAYLFNCSTALERLPVYSVTFRGEKFGCGEDDTGEVCTAATPASE